MASIGPDSSMANLDDDDNKASGPKDDTIGSLLSPNEAYSRKRRTPGASEKQQQLAPDNGAGVARRRQSRAHRKALAVLAGQRRAERRGDIIRAEVAELLPPKAADLIFTGLAPIYDLHRDIESDLRAALANWDTGSTTIGSVFASRADKLSQLYPPFVNFFGQAKEELAKWEKKCSKFRAYLRQCRDRPECLRQSLSDLMIRPVQRLPSVTLILADLLKYTNRLSLSSSRSRAHQRRKRTTDLRVALFDVMNEVENFPPYLLSAHRTIVDRFDVVEARCRPDLFLLTDYLLVAKRRQSVASSASTASSAGGGGGGGGPGSSNRYRSPRPGPGSISTRTPSAAKPLRYLELVPLNSVRAVHDIRAPAVDPEDRRRLFAIECRLAACDDTDDEVVNEASTIASGGGRDKSSILRSVCEQIGRVTCCPNPLDLLLSHSDPAAFPLNLVGIFDRQNLLSAKARRFGRRVVTRVLSNRTPRRTISRALLAAATAAAPSASTQQQPDKAVSDHGTQAGTPRVAANPRLKMWMLTAESAA
uniref:DH domain-containing protein n=1 Tax=Macrostomum lignano TaxID=282301 RepID=A0A1I8F2A0_9PLAT